MAKSSLVFPIEVNISFHKTKGDKFSLTTQHICLPCVPEIPRSHGKYDSNVILYDNWIGNLQKKFLT